MSGSVGRLMPNNGGSDVSDEKLFTSSGFYKSKEALMSVCNRQALLANDEQPEGSLRPASGRQNHEEALDVCYTCWMVYVHSWAVEEVHSAFLNQSCSTWHAGYVTAAETSDTASDAQTVVTQARY